MDNVVWSYEEIRTFVLTNIVEFYGIWASVLVIFALMTKGFSVLINCCLGHGLSLSNNSSNVILGHKHSLFNDKASWDSSDDGLTYFRKRKKK